MPRAIAIVFMLFISSVVFSQNDTINRINSAGEKIGYWKKSVDGVLKYEGTFVNGKPQGEFKYYHPEGNIKAMSFFYNYGINARTFLYRTNGSKVADGHYENQLKDSIWTYYNEASIIIAKDVFFKGVKHGLCKTFYDTGELNEEQIWENGVQRGIRKQYFENGKIKSEASFNNGKLNGLTTINYSNGRIHARGKYINDVRHGRWDYFNHETKLEKFEIFNMGVLKKEKILIKKPKTNE